MMDKKRKPTQFTKLNDRDKDLTMFTITNLTFTNEDDVVHMTRKENSNMVHMTLKLKRKVVTELLTTYLPTILLLLITFVTIFFDKDLFGDAIAVNLTIMLVMTTIFTSKIEELPPPSDLKMLDIWLIFCQLVPFTEMVLITARDYFREVVKKKRENGKENDDKPNLIPACCLAIVPRNAKSVAKLNSVAAEQEGRIPRPGELTAVTVQPLETQVIIPHPHLQEEGETEGKEEKEGKKGMDEEDGKGWRERVVEGLEVTGDPLVPTPPRVLHPPHPRPRPHRHLHLLCCILLP